MERYIFYILAVLLIVSAIAAVSSKKMLRSVIYLLFTLCGIAGIYFLIDYNFLAAIQLTVYAGGIIVLIIFSVILVHHIEMELEVAKLSKKLLVGAACALGLGVFLATIYAHDFKVVENFNTTTTEQIGLKLLSYEAGGFILPFELISVLLLASMIGAIVIAKGKKLVKSEKSNVESIQKNNN
ncbi:NADH dehydrogenase subunit J [Lutibacter agarilyticus]|uniref:NADH-quinone oxidoreductase subunit J n=1 Tax=Lutibacter agarilyticus TaxID=1109740 RepID=A0A238XBR4_9FLAO|nr:NADH-quinone oxidoreductase subunit J [Lutibacter agarilyticus]SNR56042.1 NADH dehydrogenase subunit J [Lutibacter agarilyticus]